MKNRFDNSGFIVKHKKTGKRGRTFNNKGIIKGKIPVYFETQKRLEFEKTATLCNQDNLEIQGYID